MTKYKEYYQKMLEENSEAFEEFEKIHNKYLKNPSKFQEKFNSIGKPIMEIIRSYEDKLCSRSEGNGYAQYTGNLADKFWDEIRRDFEMIDRVGIIIKKAPAFELKKINL